MSSAWLAGLRWIHRPAWFLASLLAALAAVVSLAVIGGVLYPQRTQIEDLQRQIQRRQAEILHYQRQLESMPTPEILRGQLAESGERGAPLGSVSFARRLVRPFARSGAVLRLWQPETAETPETAEEEGVAGYAAGRLSFDADYPGLLRFLREFVVLPDAPRIERLAIEVQTSALRIDMMLTAPATERRESFDERETNHE